MRSIAVLAITVAALLVGGPAPAAASPAKSKVKAFPGTLVTVGKAQKSVRLARGRRPGMRFKVTRSTRLTGLARRSALKKGQVVTITARKTKRGWVATKIVVRSKGPSAPAPGTGNGDDDTGILPGDEIGDDDPLGDEGGGDDPYGDDPYGDDPYGDDPYGDGDGGGF